MKKPRWPEAGEEWRASKIRRRRESGGMMRSRARPVRLRGWVKVRRPCWTVMRESRRGA